MNTNRNGFTLIEVLFSATIALTILGAAFGIFMQVRDTSSALTMNTAARAEAEKAMQIIVREISQASLASISPLPGAAIIYRIPVDNDGDGTALDAQHQVEWSPGRGISRDTMDANHDGFGEDQLVLITEQQVTVLANGLAPDKDDGNTKDTTGIWFESVPGGIRATVCIQRITSPDRHVLTETLTETINMRNQ